MITLQKRKMQDKYSSSVYGLCLYRDYRFSMPDQAGVSGVGQVFEVLMK